MMMRKAPWVSLLYLLFSGSRDKVGHLSALGGRRVDCGLIPSGLHALQMYLMIGDIPFYSQGVPSGSTPR